MYSRPDSNTATARSALRPSAAGIPDGVVENGRVDFEPGGRTEPDRAEPGRLEIGLPAAGLLEPEAVAAGLAEVGGGLMETPRDGRGLTERGRADGGCSEPRFASSRVRFSMADICRGAPERAGGREAATPLPATRVGRVVGGLTERRVSMSAASLSTAETD
jgi:hypothetical protein